MQHIINDLIHSALIWAAHVDWSEVTNGFFDVLNKAWTIMELVLIAKVHNEDAPKCRPIPGAPKRGRKRNSSYRLRKGMRKR
ncbi:hypothetical protein [Paenibacillus polymyxa]|uniref:hypothetical protein n=1 Tax=Paenibacillus polymyxa TaxID=1406 RepID=UPI00111B3DFE|nr:hypothetical protein [Paenibacillus polymyxa]QDA30271.1 hypothetical protein FGY93_25505 [Paenibacillus polymyxa]